MPLRANLVRRPAALRAAGVLVSTLGLCFACGGKATDYHPAPADGETPATPPPDEVPSETVDVASLRFSKIVAARDYACGLTQPESRLVCFREDEIVSDDPGPYRDFDLSDEVDYWQLRCTVSDQGALACTTGEVPAGEYSSVHVGIFNACARRTTGELECELFASAGGGFETVVDPGGSITVDMWTLCSQGDLHHTHAACFDRFGDALLPGQGHYVAVVAAPAAACAAVLATPGESADLLGRNHVACFTAQGAESKLEGLFHLLDVDANQNGCALGAEGLKCWGPLERSVPPNLETENVSQLSVSTERVCLLYGDGVARCFEA